MQILFSTEDLQGLRLRAMDCIANLKPRILAGTAKVPNTSIPVLIDTCVDCWGLELCGSFSCTALEKRT